MEHTALTLDDTKTKLHFDKDILLAMDGALGVAPRVEGKAGISFILGIGLLPAVPLHNWALMHSLAGCFTDPQLLRNLLQFRYNISVLAVEPGYRSPTTMEISDAAPLRPQVPTPPTINDCDRALAALLHPEDVLASHYYPYAFDAVWAVTAAIADVTQCDAQGDCVVQPEDVSGEQIVTALRNTAGLRSSPLTGKVCVFVSTAS